MANADGGFSPTVIPDVPIPILDTSTLNQNTGSGNGSKASVDSENGLSPTVIKDAQITSPPIAIEVIGTSLDTQQRRILGSFVFGKVGALKVGSYVPGVSGEIDISPNGITAVNSSNVTTFSIDGTTGNATFKGTIAAGSLISGDLVLGGVGNGNGLLQVYDASSTKLIQLDNVGITLYNSTSLQLSNPSAGNYGYFGPDITNGQVVMQTAVGIPMLFSLNGNVTFQMGAFSQGNMILNANHVQFSNNASLSGSMDVSHQFSCGTLFVNNVSKTAIVPTSKGYKALYTAEAPEVWFFDFAENKDTIDPLFLEVTEGEIKTIACVDGSIQIWRRRKEFGTTRFESKTAEQFIKNNVFWSQPQG